MFDSQTIVRRMLVATVFAHAVLMFTAFFGLVSVFDFPHILRESPGTILRLFRERRALVQGFYAAFMWSQIAFVGVALALRERFGPDVPLIRMATQLGVIAGFAQAIGFSRWPFVVGSLADSFSQNPELSLTVLDTVHRTIGVAIGEHLFFCFEALWAVGMGLHFATKPTVTVSKCAGRLLVGIGVAIGVYSLEQFGGPFAVLGPVNVLAHGALLYWLLGLAIAEWRSRPLRWWERALLTLAWAATVSG